MLKPNGKLILTAPFGRATETWQRIDDLESLEQLRARFQIVKVQYQRESGGAWIAATEDEVRNEDSSSETRAVTLLVACKIELSRSQIHGTKPSQDPDAAALPALPAG